MRINLLNGLKKGENFFKSLSILGFVLMFIFNSISSFLSLAMFYVYYEPVRPQVLQLLQVGQAFWLLFMSSIIFYGFLHFLFKYLYLRELRNLSFNAKKDGSTKRRKK